MTTQIMVAAKEEEILFWEAAERIKTFNFKKCMIRSLPDAVNLARSGKFSVIILSTGLMQNEHMHLLKELAKDEQVKIIVAGGFQNFQDECTIRNAGIYCYLILPDEIGMLKSAIKAAMISYNSEKSVRDKLYMKGKYNVSNQ